MKCIFALLIGIAAASGCATEGTLPSNAVLELEIVLPPGPTDGSRVFALTQVRNADFSNIEDEWLPVGDPPTVELSPGMSVTDNASVVATTDAIDLLVKVRFCSTESCTAIDDTTAPEAWFTLGHPLYLGERTTWETSLLEIPAGRGSVAETVDRCDIYGCVDGPLSSYCRVSGEHLCDPGRPTGYQLLPDSDRVHDL